jgi:hypothetical protein
MIDIILSSIHSHATKQQNCWVLNKFIQKLIHVESVGQSRTQPPNFAFRLATLETVVAEDEADDDDGGGGGWGRKALIGGAAGLTAEDCVGFQTVAFTDWTLYPGGVITVVRTVVTGPQEGEGFAENKDRSFGIVDVFELHFSRTHMRSIKVAKSFRIIRE